MKTAAILKVGGPIGSLVRRGLPIAIGAGLGAYAGHDLADPLVAQSESAFADSLTDSMPSYTPHAPGTGFEGIEASLDANLADLNRASRHIGGMAQGMEGAHDVQRAMSLGGGAVGATAGAMAPPVARRFLSKPKKEGPPAMKEAATLFYR